MPTTKLLVGASSAHTIRGSADLDSKIRHYKERDIQGIQMFMHPKDFYTGVKDVLAAGIPIPAIHVSHSDVYFDLGEGSAVNPAFVPEEMNRDDYHTLCLEKSVEAAKLAKSKVMVLHVEHYTSDVNIEQEKISAEKKVINFLKDFVKKYTPKEQEFIRKITAIENMPEYDKNLSCYCITPETMKRFTGELGFNYCIDMGHVYVTAKNLQMDPYRFMEDFLKLDGITIYHVSDIPHPDGKETLYRDAHLHLGTGSMDLKRVKEIINSKPGEKIITLEIPDEGYKPRKKDLDYFNSL